MTHRFIPLVLFFYFIVLVEQAQALTKYEVKEGDTLWKISKMYRVPLMEVILKNNQLNNPNMIFPGDELIIPIKTHYKNELSEEELKLLQLTNDKRIETGLPPLKMDISLANAAKQKAYDMLKHGYVAHRSPTFGYPTLMLDNLNIPFQSVKENIGAGHKNANTVFEVWMKSSIQRENILDEEATHIGIGYVKGGLHGHYWTIFIISKP